jgi:hypothetical protein
MTTGDEKELLILPIFYVLSLTRWNTLADRLKCIIEESKEIGCRKENT